MSPATLPPAAEGQDCWRSFSLFHCPAPALGEEKYHLGVKLSAVVTGMLGTGWGRGPAEEGADRNLAKGSMRQNHSPSEAL